MIFKKIVGDVADICGQDDSGDFQVMAKAAVNRIYRRLLIITDSETEMREFSLTTEADKAQYGLPLYVQSVLNIEDAANQRRIYDITRREFDDSYPGDTTTGDPQKAYPVGEFGVSRQPDAASTLDLVSDSTSDTGSHKVRVTGFDSNAHMISDLISLDGTNTVVSSLTFKTVERVTKSLTNDSAVWNGAIFVNDTAQNDNLATIPIWWDSPSYVWYEFWPIPDAAYTFTIRALGRKQPLFNDEDWPEIDDNFHHLLLLGAAMDLLPVVGKVDVAQTVRRDFELGVSEMQGHRDHQPNLIRTFGDVTTWPYMPRRPWIEGVDF